MIVGGVIRKRKDILVALNSADLYARYEHRDDRMVSLLTNIRNKLSDINTFEKHIEKIEVDKFEIIAKNLSWKFAKTMPENPHYYTLLGQCVYPEIWFSFVDFINRHSVEEVFESNTY